MDMSIPGEKFVDGEWVDCDFVNDRNPGYIMRIKGAEEFGEVGNSSVCGGTLLTIWKIRARTPQEWLARKKTVSLAT